MNENKVGAENLDLFEGYSKEIEESFDLSTKTIVQIVRYVKIEKENIEWLNYIINCIKDHTKSEIVIICIEGMVKIFKYSQIDHQKNYIFMEKHINEASKKLIIERLWNFLDKTNQDKKVVELLIRIENMMGAALSDSVLRELQSAQITKKVEAINRFSHFWKFSGNKNPHFFLSFFLPFLPYSFPSTHTLPILLPFKQPLNQKPYKITTAEYFPQKFVFQEESLCLFNMVDFLNNDHPLVRHSSKSWIAQSTHRLSAILDPILHILLQSTSGSNSYLLEDSQLFYANSYDTRRVINSFHKLGSILITAKDEFMNYISNTALSTSLLILFQTDSAKRLFIMAASRDLYLNALIFISMKYIVGQVCAFFFCFLWFF